MTFAMPPVRQLVSPNYSVAPVRHDNVFVHRCEGSYAGSVAWLCDPRAKASAHLVMKADGSEVTQLVPLSMKAWAQCAFNANGVSLEIEGYTAQGLSQETSRAAAAIVAWLCRAYAIAPVWAQGGRGPGVCQHVDLGAAGGGHHDACGLGSPTWLAFMAFVRDAYDALGNGPLPAFALHGPPNPHQLSLPPYVSPTASHGGAARIDPAEAATSHSTQSGYPHGSVADLQWRLNRNGALPPLLVDGFAGPLTRSAIAAFQRDQKLSADGLLGAETWAALFGATAA
ncbi:MAG TPA: N-acetylmuramoyl-L-alanine amidase [Roseiarcus sp.]|nr:N-acetylmuramoyl-L-alanine amidase [Roseiarcus sp.]